jgi:GT2 family glycosyltransferase
MTHPAPRPAIGDGHRTERHSDHLVVLIGFDDAEAVGLMVSTLRSFDRAPDVLVIENGRADYSDTTVEVSRPNSNLGYTGAANEGIRLGFERGYSFVTIANSDVEITADAFGHLRRALDQAPADVAVIGGVEVGTDDAVNTVGGETWSRWTGSDRWTTDVPADRDMLFVQGAFVTVTQAITVLDGPFDDRLFMFFDEIELGLRVRAAGLRTIVVPEFRYRHDNAAGRYRPLRGYLIWRNRALVSRRHAGATAPLAHAIGLARLLCGVVARLPQPRADYTRASVTGWWDGVRGVTDLDRVPGLKYVTRPSLVEPDHRPRHTGALGEHRHQRSA